MGGEVADRVEGWEMWLKMYEGIVRWWRWENIGFRGTEAGNLHTGRKENMYDSRAKDKI